MSGRLKCRGGRWSIVGPGGKVLPLAWQEAALIIALMGSREVTWEKAFEAVWPDPDSMPDSWLTILRVLVCRLRKKMADAGVKATVRTIFGRGWRLEVPA